MLLGHTASARLDSCSGMMPVTLGKALTVTWAVLSDAQIVPCANTLGSQSYSCPLIVPSLVSPPLGRCGVPQTCGNAHPSLHGHRASRVNQELAGS